jgi:hypothetical protein
VEKELKKQRRGFNRHQNVILKHLGYEVPDARVLISELI